MAAAEDLVEGDDLINGSPGSGVHPEAEDERERRLLDIIARQQVLLENIVICDHMLVQLHRLRKSLAEKETKESDYKVVDQSKSENFQDLQSDFQHNP